MHLSVIVLTLLAQLDPAVANEPALANEAEGAATPAETAAKARVSALSSSQAWGIGLVTVGASVAAASTVAFTLIEGITTPDRASNPVVESTETFTQGAGFSAIALASLSAVAMVVGTSLILIDEEPTKSPSTATTATTAPPETPSP